MPMEATPKIMQILAGGGTPWPPLRETLPTPSGSLQNFHHSIVYYVNVLFVKQWWYFSILSINNSQKIKREQIRTLRVRIKRA